MSKIDSETLQQVEIARKKLLDLTMRNSLLNFKHSERSSNQIRIVDNSICDIYNDLMEDKSKEILPLPELPTEPKDEQTQKFINAFEIALISDEKYILDKENLEKTDNTPEDAEEKIIRELKDRVRQQLGLPPRTDVKDISKKEWAKEQNINPSYDNDIEGCFTDRNSKNFLQTLLYPKELKNKITTLKRIVKSDREEKGTNTFYIAFGFLEWYEQKNSDIKHHAPLLLLRLNDLTINNKSGISINSAGDAVLTNLSLQEKLKEFQLILPDFEEDDTPETYLTKVSKLIECFPKWKVRSYITIGRFVFSRLAMYEDLNITHWTALLSNKSSLLSTLFNSRTCTGSDNHIYDIDRDEDVKNAPLLISSADSSQHSAIIDVMKNKNLVIKGPPGTGKSQTITNLIANALNAGKKVLFMAEKKAALDVVFSRLKEAGLDDYCFELHSDKTNITHIRQELEKSYIRYRLGINTPVPANNDVKMEYLLHQKKYLREYYDLLQTKIGNLDKTIFELVWNTKNLEKDMKEYPTSLKKMNIPSVLKLTNIDFETDVDELSQLALLEEKYKIGLETLKRKWDTISYCDISVKDALTLSHQIQFLSERLEKYSNEQKNISLKYALNISDNIIMEEKLFEHIKNLDHLLQDENMVLDNIKALENKENYILIEKLINLLNSYNELCKKAKNIYNEPQYFANNIDTYANIFDVMIKADLNIKTLDNITAAKDQFKNELADWENSNNLNEIAALIFEKQEFLTSELCAIKEILNNFKKSANLLPLYPLEIFKSYNWEMLDKIAETSSILNAEKEKLAEYFDMDSVFEYQDIEKNINSAISAIATSGLFSFFKTEYRDAKKTYKLLSIEKSVSKERMLDNYRKLYKYLKQYNSFKKNKNYQSLLGNYFDEVDNVINDIQTVKSFHQKLNLIENKYGSSISSTIKKFFLKKENFDYFQKIINLSSSISNFETYTDTKLSVPIKDYLKTLRYKYELSKLLNDNFLKNFQSKSITIEEILSTRLSLTELNILKEDIEKLCRQLSSIIPSLTNGIKSDTNKLKNLLNIGKSLYNEDFISDKNAFIQLLISNQFPNIQKIILQQNQHLQDIINELETIKRLFIFGGNEFQEQKYKEKSFNDILEYLNELNSNKDIICNICGFYCKLKETKGKKYADVVSYLHENKLSLKNSIKIYSYLVYNNLLNETNYNSWETYTPDEFKDYVNSIQQLENEVYDINSKLLLYRLNRTPVPEGINSARVSEKTELQLILHQISGHARRIPLRKFLKKAGKAIQALRPCFLMSPISVAQYISPHSITFDLLIIDEASQMYLEEALGGIFRAKQIVVVGDDKQLPPTPFFQKALNQDDDIDEENEILDDLSVLDTCLVRGFENRELLWHYRSKDTSLIAFSNKNFYNDNLKLFPSPIIQSNTNGIQYIYVGGCCKSRQNEKEVDAIIKEIKLFVRKYPNRSLGIATMNTTQKMLLEKKCDQLYDMDIHFQKYCDKWSNGLESFFVKNLENVQGDERDYIFISTVYGPEVEGGRVLQRFGPINGKHGHRRLNVLFTRAKFGLKLFTSMHSQDIVINETSSLGLKIFKDYLLYAETGRIDNGHVQKQHFDSEFEKMVYDILSARGYEVDTQVGVKGFFIDLAIKHPKNKDYYALGIECDGAPYHSTKSARDRDCIRQSILEDLGWQIYRIWSKDWYYNTEKEIDKLLCYVEKTINEKTFSNNQKDIIIDEDINDFKNSINAINLSKNFEDVSIEISLSSPCLDVTNKHIEGYNLNGNYYPVNSWGSLYQSIMTLLIQEYRQTKPFPSTIVIGDTIGIKKGRYVQLYNGQFLNIHYSADNIIKRVKEILYCFDIDFSSCTLYLKNKIPLFDRELKNNNEEILTDNSETDVNFTIKALHEIEKNNLVNNELSKSTTPMEFLWTKKEQNGTKQLEKRVEVFDKVTYIRLSDNSEHFVQITNKESCIEKNLINKNTALAQALMDAEEGEEIEVNDKMFRIKEIIKNNV